MRNHRLRVPAAVALLGLVGACTVTDPSPSPAGAPSASPRVTAAATQSALSTPRATSPAATGTPASSSAVSPGGEAGSVEPAPADATLAGPLEDLLDDWVTDGGPPGAVLGVRLADGRTAVVSSGRTDAEAGVPVEPGHRFRIGSITKTFVATLVLQLVDEGLLALDEPLERHLPGAPHASEVTVAQLLDHTSGIFDFAALPEYRSAMLTNPGRAWQPSDVIGLLSDRDLDFRPGTRWAYSNTNYVLLGMLVEEVTGEPLAGLLRSRIYRPLGLDATFLEELEAAPPMSVNGHFDLDGDANPDSLRRIPYTALVTSGAAAGGIGASALDVLDFAAGLVQGELLAPESLERMRELRGSADDYGLGVAWFDLDGRRAWGHSGGLPGFSTLLVHVPDTETTVVALANETGADVMTLVERALTILPRAGE